MSFHLPSGTRLGPVHLQVSSAERSVDYYQHVIGLRVLGEESGHVTLGAQDDNTPLVVVFERQDARPVRPQSVLGLYHFAILLPERAALGRFLTHLSAVGGRVGMADHAVSESVYLTDPDGLGIEVYADRPRSTWRRDEHGQLFMTTAPLNVPDVIAAADGSPWTGAPAATRIGHLHLHVGDLGQAERFYGDGVGFDKTVWTYPGALFFAADGYHHHLGTNTWASGPSASEDQARLRRWHIVVPSSADVAAARTSIAAVAAVHDETPDGFSATDPWGTTVTIHVAH